MSEKPQSSPLSLSTAGDKLNISICATRFSIFETANPENEISVNTAMRL